MDEFQSVFAAITVYQNQYTQVDKLWNYFSIVSLAVAGFVIGSEKATKSMKESLAIVGAYAIFCVGNNRALVDGQKQLEQLSGIAIDLATMANIELDTLTPLSPEYIFKFQAVVSISVCFGVMIIAYLRKD